MRNVSKKFLETMQERRDFYAVAEITFASGVKKTISKSDLTISGNSIYDGGGSSSFPLGLLIPRQINLSLDNHDDRWSEYDFYGAKISLKTVFDFDDGESEEINIGEYTIVTPESYGTVVGITAVDDSYKADKDYSTSLLFPVSLGAALQDSCTTCGINLLTEAFPNSDYEISEKPQNLTHRQFIGMCAMIAGGNAKFDEQNRLKIVPYDFSTFENASWIDGGTFAPWSTGDNVDGGSFEPWTSGQNVDGGAFGDRDGIHILYQFAPGIKIEADDVVITGVQMESEDAEGNKTTHLFGTTGYVLSVENQLAKGNEDEALKLIGAKIVGLRFRPFTGDHIALPTAESMDLAVIIDRKNNAYTTVLTDVDFTYFGFTSMKCTADSPIRNQSIYYGNETKAIVQARQMVETEKTQRELAVEALAKQLADGNGLYMTTESQAGGGNIYYMHDKPSLKESKVVWKLTANAFGISTDGGKTYPYGLDATGTAILDRIYAIGIDADHITTGKFEIRKDDGTILALLDKDTKQVILRPDTFTLSSGQTVEQVAESKADSAANDALNSAKNYTDSTAKTTLQSANGYADTASKNAVSSQTQLDIFNKLTNGGKEQGIFLKDGKIYINAQYMSVDYLSAISTNLGIVTAGIIQSANYAYQNGNFATAGFFLNLASGIIRSKNFGIDLNGNAYFKGTLEGATGNFTGDVTANSIKVKDTLYLFDDTGSSVDALWYSAKTDALWLGNTLHVSRINIGNENSIRELHFYANSIYENDVELSNKYAPVSHTHNNYLLTTGGTLSGSLTLPNGSVVASPTGLRFSSGAAVYSSGAQQLCFQASTEINYMLRYGVVDRAWALAPNKDTYLFLGRPNNKWGTIYSNNGTISTSDARRKNSITPISAAYEAVFNQLRPVTYRFNSGDRVHTGFISQDIEKSLDDNGMTGEDWAAFCKDDDGNGDFVYGLRYEEIIALNTHMIQKLMKRVDELEAEIRELKGVI